MGQNAEKLFSEIGDKKHVKRPKEQNEDRHLRNLVEDAQRSGRLIVNVGDGEGYFEADLNDPEQAMAYQRYIRQKKSRVRKMEESIRAMEETAQNLYQMELEYE